MVRIFVCGLAALVGLVGCGGKPPAAQNPAERPAAKPAENAAAKPAAKPATKLEVNPWIAAMAEEAKAKAEAEKNPPPKVNLPPIEFPPDSPKGFQGNDLAESDPIPPEIQQDLKKWGEEGAKRKVELLMHPHPRVRAEAAKELRYVDHKNFPGKVAALRGAMRDRNAKVRMAAAEGLGSGPEGKAALLELRAMIRDPNPEVSGQGILALNYIGPEAAPALPELYPLLLQPNNPNLGWVTMAIGSMGPAAKEAAPHLVTTLDWWSSNGGEVLGKIGAEKELLEAMSGGNAKRVEHAARGVGHLKNPSPAVVAKVTEIAQGGSDARYNAMWSLGKIHPTTKEMAAIFIRALGDSSSGMRLTALEALEESDPKFPEAGPALLAAANDKDELVRGSVAKVLAMYPAAADVRLKVALDDILREGVVGYSSAGDVLVKNAKEFQPLLAKIAADPKEDEARRGAAIFCLNSMANWRSGEERKTATAEVNAVVTPWLAADQPATVRAAVACILRANDVPRDDALVNAWIAGIKGAKFNEARKNSIDLAADGKDERVRDALAAMLDQSETSLHGEAAKKLAAYRASAAASIPRLIVLVSNPKSYYRREYYEAIGTIGVRPDLTGPFLRKQLDDKDFYPSLWAMEALGRVSAKNDLDATPIFVKAERHLSTKELYGKRDVVRALGGLGPKGGLAVRMIVAFMQSAEKEEDDDREAAVETLGEIGPAAKAAVPALLKMLEQGQEVDECLEALTKIRHCGPELARLAPKLFQTVALRSKLLETFVALGAEAKDAAPAIADLLDSNEDQDRREALECLAKLGPAAVSVAPRLRKAVEEEKSDWVRQTAVQTLLAVDPKNVATLEALIVQNSKRPDWQQAEFLDQLAKTPDAVAKALESERPAVRLAALSAVPKAFPDEKGLPIYEKALADKDEAVRWAAAKRLIASKRSAPGLLEAVVGHLDDDAARGVVQSAGRKAAPLLAKVVLDDSKNAAQREGAVEALRSMRLNDRTRLALFAEGLRSKSPETRFWALSALDEACVEMKEEATKIVIENLGSKDEQRRRKALDLASRLTWAGPDEKIAPPELIEAILAVAAAAEGDDLTHELQRALGHNAERPEAVKTILKMASDPKKVQLAAELSNHLRGVRDPALPPLFAAGLKNCKENDASTFSLALSQQGRAGSALLLEALADPQSKPHVRRAAAGSLMGRAQPSKEEVDQVAALLAAPETAPYAAIVLQSWDYQGKSLVEPLFALLQSDHAYSYWIVGHLKQRIKEGDKGVAALAPALWKMAADPKNESRQPAFHLLAALAQDDAQRAKLIDFIADQERHYDRVELAQALGRHGDEAPSAMKVIADALPAAKGDRQERLLELLTAYLPKKEEAEGIVKALKPFAESSNTKLQLVAARALANGDYTDDKLVALLMKSAADKEEEDRYEYFRTLERLGPKAAAAAAPLIELLDDEEWGDNAARVLGRIGPAAVGAVPKLMAKLDGPDSDAAGQALGGIGPGARAAVPALLSAFSSGDKQARYLAVITLPTIHPEALLEALRKELADPERRLEALRTFNSLRSDIARPALPQIVETLRSTDPEERFVALQLLTRLAPADEAYEDQEGVTIPALPPIPRDEAERAFAAVAPLLGDPVPSTAATAASALGALKVQPEKTVPLLVKALAHPKRRVKEAAAMALVSFETAAAPGVATIAAWLDDPALRLTALEALGGIGASSAPAVPAILQIATTELPPSDDDELSAHHFRWRAIEALGGIGPAASAAVPELTKIYASKHKVLSRHAGEALLKIDPAAAERAGVEPPKEKK